MEERILRLTDTAATTGLSQVVEAFHPNEDIRIPVAAAESVEILPDSVKNIPTKPPLEVVEELVVTPLILPESSPSTPPQGADNANSSQPLRNPFPLRRTPMIRRKNRRIRDQRRALPRGVDNAARTVEVMERQQRTLDEISQRLALVSQRLLDITDHLISIRDLIGRNN
ncbi:uncharacterized protein LOC129216609 [Uloborus diversus]|uniref:uncharacterized protein LOC129216609 n=1 Tax=Uloborus diversus TaxID=327109 RepID=UPI00240A4E44|nr:uncharacterized protein LOC129216609 [Uloborus diversus]